MKFVFDKRSGQMVPSDMLKKLYPPEATYVETAVSAWLDGNIQLIIDNSYSTRVLAEEFLLSHPEFSYDTKEEIRTACAKWFNANQDKVEAEEHRRSSTESRGDRFISPMKTIKLAKVGADGITVSAGETIHASQKGLSAKEREANFEKSLEKSSLTYIEIFRNQFNRLGVKVPTEEDVRRLIPKAARYGGRKFTTTHNLAGKYYEVLFDFADSAATEAVDINFDILTLADAKEVIEAIAPRLAQSYFWDGFVTSSFTEGSYKPKNTIEWIEAIIKIFGLALKEEARALDDDFDVQEFIHDRDALDDLTEWWGYMKWTPVSTAENNTLMNKLAAILRRRAISASVSTAGHADYYIQVGYQGGKWLKTTFDRGVYKHVETPSRKENFTGDEIAAADFIGDWLDINKGKKANEGFIAAAEGSLAKSKKYWFTFGDWEGSRCLLKFDKPVSQEQAKAEAKKLKVLQENITGYGSLVEAEQAVDRMEKSHAQSYGKDGKEKTKIISLSAKEGIEDIPEENKNGDCYQQAWKTFYANIDKNPLLVHGIVEGRGPLSGVKYNHAWVEIGDMVYDKTMSLAANGIDKRVYYSIGNIDDKYCGTAGLVFRYTSKQVSEKAVEWGTYGPWEDIMWKYP